MKVGSMLASSRRSTSLSLDRSLVDEARRLGVNLSRAAEAGVAEAVRAARRRQWQDDHADAIAAYNRYIETQGLPLAARRKF